MDGVRKQRGWRSAQTAAGISSSLRLPLRSPAHLPAVCPNTGTGYRVKSLWSHLTFFAESQTKGKVPMKHSRHPPSAGTSLSLAAAACVTGVMSIQLDPPTATQGNGQAAPSKPELTNTDRDVSRPPGASAQAPPLTLTHWQPSLMVATEHSFWEASLLPNVFAHPTPCEGNLLCLPKQIESP